MGAGGIGFDVADFISHDGPSAAQNIDVFAREWGIDFKNHPRGGVTGIEPEVASAPREISHATQGNGCRQGFGQNHGLDHRLTLSRRGVKMMNGIEYLKIDDRGLHFCATTSPTILRWTRSSSVPARSLCATFSMPRKRAACPLNWSAGLLKPPNWTPRPRFIRPVTWQRLFKPKPFIRFPAGHRWFQYSAVRQARHRGAAQFRHKPVTSSCRAWLCGSDIGQSPPVPKLFNLAQRQAFDSA